MSKENKGICYVKYDKASSAALAIENMDGKLVGSEPKPIKVYTCTLYMYIEKVRRYLRVIQCTCTIPNSRG